MSKKPVYLMVLVIVLMGVLGLAFRVQWVEASGTIYIRATGLVEGTDKIQCNGNVYTFVGDINDAIVVEKDDIVIDGANHALSGNGSYGGIELTDRKNVTIKQVEISGFQYGILSMYNSLMTEIRDSTIRNCSKGGVDFGGDANITIHGNTIANIDGDGIHISSSDYIEISQNNITGTKDGIEAHNCAYVNISRNTLLGNNDSAIELMENSEFITMVRNSIANNYIGVMMYETSNSSVCENNITDNQAGVLIWVGYNNTICENKIIHNKYGMVLEGGSSDNIVCYNSFINNTHQVACEPGTGPNFLDDGLGRGNYWSDYLEGYPDAHEIDDTDIWDTPYVVDENNVDHYPIVPEFATCLILPLFMIATLLAVIVYRRKQC